MQNYKNKFPLYMAKANAAAIPNLVFWAVLCGKILKNRTKTRESGSKTNPDVLY